jgi:hypothetical protein
MNDFQTHGKASACARNEAAAASQLQTARLAICQRFGASSPVAFRSKKRWQYGCALGN